MFKRCLFFYLVVIIFFSYSCSSNKQIGSTLEEPPIEILYPPDNFNFPSGNVVILASFNALLQEPSLLVDGKYLDYKLQNTSVPGLHLFYVNLSSGKHIIEVSATGPDVMEYKSAISRGRDYREVEKALKEVKWRKYKESIDVAVSQGQKVLKLVPLTYSEYLAAKQPLANAPIYKLIPPGSDLLVATGMKSVLVRTKRGLSQSYWVLPAMDENKAEDLFNNGKPVITIVDDNNASIEIPSPAACNGNRDVFVVQEYKKINKDYAFVYHFLYEDGSVKSISVKEKDIINKIFNGGQNPWQLSKDVLLKNNYLGILPSMSAPLICTDKAVAQEINLNCIWIKCDPSVVSFHLLVNQDGTFRVIKSSNTVKELTWRGSEILLPVSTTEWALLDLKEGLYKLIDNNKQYKLPFKTMLPARFSDEYYFQGRTLKSITQPWDVQLTLKENDRSIYSLYEIFFGRKILLKTTLMFIHKWQGESRFEEVPVRYEVSVPD